MVSRQLQKIQQESVTTSAAPYEPPQQFQYAEALALSLVVYAGKNFYFAERLAEMVRELPAFQNSENPEIRAHASIEILIPPDTNTALKRAGWLIERIKERNLSGSRRAATILCTWARTRTVDDPKQIVLGVIVVAIPKVTIGKFARRKKMSVIVRRDAAILRRLAVAAYVTHASLGLLVDAIDMAYGNVGQLEPEFADWLFGEQTLSFYKTDGKRLIAIEEELRHLSVAHATIEENGEIAVLAVSPVVNSVHQGMRWGLEAFQI